jgi:hypothetical protein
MALNPIPQSGHVRRFFTFDKHAHLGMALTPLMALSIEDSRSLSSRYFRHHTMTSSCCWIVHCGDGILPLRCTAELTTSHEEVSPAPRHHKQTRVAPRGRTRFIGKPACPTSFFVCVASTLCAAGLGKFVCRRRDVVSLK